MSEMVERVAKAVGEIDFSMPGAGGLRGNLKIAPGMAKKIARVAIEAMREPECEMCMSAAAGPHAAEYIELLRADGARKFDMPEEAVHTEAMGPAMAYAVWRLMINAALEPAPACKGPPTKRDSA